MKTTPACPATGRSAGRSPGAHVFFWSLTGVAAALDLVTKAWAFACVPASGVIMIDNVLEFVPKLNRGAVFSIGHGGRWFFVMASVIAMGFIFHLFFQSRPRQRGFHFFLALIMGGAIGNLYDRVLIGPVRDFIFISVSIRGWSVWPAVFNVADAFLCIGVGGLVVGWLTGWFNMHPGCPVARPVAIDAESAGPEERN